MSSPDFKFSAKDFQVLGEVFKEKNVREACSRCGHPKFHISNGFYNFPRQINSENLGVSGTHSPTIMTYCANCGHMVFHSITVFGVKFEDGELRRV